MEWYTTTLSFIQKFFPRLGKTRQTSLALLTYGILKHNTAWPLSPSHHHLGLQYPDPESETDP
jgi:hypothetical protein